MLRVSRLGLAYVALVAMSLLDWGLTAVAAARGGGFHELNPLALGAFEAGAAWLPFSLKLAALTVTAASMVFLARAGRARAAARIAGAWAVLFAVVNAYSVTMLGGVTAEDVERLSRYLIAVVP